MRKGARSREQGAGSGEHSAGSREASRLLSFSLLPAPCSLLVAALSLLIFAALPTSKSWAQTVSVDFNNLALPSTPIDGTGLYPYGQAGYGDSGLTHYGSNGTTFLGNFWNGSQFYSAAPGAGYSAPNSNGYFSSSGVFFNNSYVDWGGGEHSWTGWSYSDVRDSTMAGFFNQYAAYPGTAVGSAGTYALAYLATSPGQGATVIPTITLPNGVEPQSISIANTTYAALSMLDGDSFAGLPYSKTNGWLSLSIQGYNVNGIATTAQPLTIYLADYRSGSGTLLSGWNTVNLSSLGENVHTITFSMNSSDTSPPYGINTPTYFAVGSLSFSANCEYWTGAQGTNWGGAGNWNPGVVPGGAGTTVVFGEESGTGNTVADVQGSRTVGAITFEAGASTTLEDTAAGSGITLNNLGSGSPIDVAGMHTLSSAVVLDNDGLVEVFGTSGQLTVSGAVSGTGGLELSGAGSLILSGSDSYRGGTNVIEGTLCVTSFSALPDDSSLTVGSGAATLFGTSLRTAVPAAGPAPVPEPSAAAIFAAAMLCSLAVGAGSRERGARRKKVTCFSPCSLLPAPWSQPPK
jgi:autotransporter-associated beta strand protein